MINASGNGEYKGFKVETWEDVEPEENIKIMTDVTGPDGQRHFLDISPYCWGSERVKVIEAVIDAGFPDRTHLGIYGPFHGSDIPAIKAFAAARA